MKMPKYLYFRVTAEHGTPVKVEYASDADVVEVVRCKDCKYYIGHRCCAMNVLAIWRENDDFCSEAERKTE